MAPACATPATAVIRTGCDGTLRSKGTSSLPCAASSTLPTRAVGPSPPANDMSRASVNVKGDGACADAAPDGEGVSTETVAGPTMPSGVCAVRDPSALSVTDAAGSGPNLTTLPSCSPWPVMRTAVRESMAAEDGETWEMEGAGR